MLCKATNKMLKLIDGLSHPSTKTELDLFSVPPTQVAVEHSRWREIPLANACTNDGPYEFHIPPTPHMLHLYKNYIIMEFRIRHANATNLVNADGLVGPINLIGKTFFNQVRLFLNGSEVFNSGNTYAYRVFLETELNFGKDAKNSQLDASLYCKDTNNIDSNQNQGFVTRAGYFAGSAWVQVMAPIHCDLFFQDRYLLNNIDIRLQLNRNINTFLLMYFGAAANPDFVVEVQHMRWLVKTVEVSPSVALAIEKTLLETTAKYPIRRVEIKTMNVAAGLRSTPSTALFNGQIPRRILLGCIDGQGFHGAYNRSPFNFQHYDIRQVSIMAAGDSFPPKPLSLNFGGNLFLPAFVQLFEGLGMGGENKGNGVDKDSFQNGACLFAFDLSPDEDDGSHWDLIREGPVSINLEFGTPLAAAIEVIVYAEFDNLLTIDRHRNPTVDYRL